MVIAVGKGTDRAYGKSEVRPKVRKPLSWELPTKGSRSVAKVGTEGWVVSEQTRVVVPPTVLRLENLGVW